MDVSKAVLITGCSSGIGRATAERLARSGWTVYASARRIDAIADLGPAGCRLLELDVTDERSMRAAVARVEEAEGAVGVLVNNAGYSLSGAIESVPLDEVRRQFETNVFGLARLCQLVLPGMRRQGFGRIVNVSSMGGRLTFPGGGYYHASKHAVEALSDALRFEVQGFGVDVIVIQPGLIRTDFADDRGRDDRGPLGGSGRPLRRLQPSGGGYDRRRLSKRDRSDARRRPGDRSRARSSRRSRLGSHTRATASPAPRGSS